MLLASLKSRRTLVGLTAALVVSIGVFAAAVIDPATEPLYSIAPYTLSNTDISSGTVKAYRPWVENGAWQGDLIEYDVSSGGDLSTTVTELKIDDFTTIPVTTVGGNWSARIQFNAAVTAAPTTYWNTGRKIIFHNGTNQTAFRWANLSGAQQTDLESEVHLNYVRGDQSNELNLNTGQGELRKRYNLLGDIIHSNPVYVGAPAQSYTLKGYDDYKYNDSGDSPSGQADRAGRVYVGANDGMLHVFDAATGDEVYAYVPSMVIGNLHKLTVNPFENHTYYVDGELSGGDADFDTNPSDNVTDWHTILVGGLGSGGKGLFALDITHPDLADETYYTDNDSKILWEKDASDADIGYIHGKAQIARLSDGKWYVIAGNGYSSTNGLAKLLVITPGGTVTKGTTDGTTGNGLSAPTLVDLDRDLDVDYAYAGDLQGNLWKFDLRAAPTTITSTKVFAAGANKPITTAPDAALHPYGGLIINFGTGSLLSATDGSSTALQSIYGIWDGAPVANTTLRTQTLSVAEYSYGTAPDDVTLNARTVTNNAIVWASGGHKGWQVDLNISGERLVSDPIIRAGRLQMVINNPIKGVDSEAGDAWLLELNYLNGGTGSAVFFDMNSDLSLDDADKVGDPALIPVGVHLGNGSFSGPQIARVSESRDSMFINGLYLPVEEACTVDCDEGFQLGHVDVDTDSPSGGTAATNEIDQLCYLNGKRADGVAVDSGGDAVATWNQAVHRTGSGAGDGVGGSTDAHQHEYDKAHGQVYMDYINLEPLCAQLKPDGGGGNDTNDLNRITEVGMGNTTEFFIIVGNADLSPGADLTIGTKTWNVVEYQKMMSLKINDWKTRLAADNTDGTLLDNDDASLIFTLEGIINGGGTIRNSFDDRAIADGGLIPTQTGCVKGDPRETYNVYGDNKYKQRWRGGALYLQAIDKAAFMADPTNLVEDKPTDLRRQLTINGVDIVLVEDTNGDGAYLTHPDLFTPALDPVPPADTAYGQWRARYADIDGAVPGDSDAFLYESTLFWHYKGACYGSPSWEANVNGALNSSSGSALHQQVEALNIKLADAENILAVMIANGEKQKKIDKQQKLVDELRAKIAELEAAQAEESVINTGLPVQVGDETPELAPSLGPNFRTGRRTWIDLTP